MNYTKAIFTSILLVSGVLFAQNSNNQYIPIEKVSLVESTIIPNYIEYDHQNAPDLNDLDDLLSPYLKGKTGLGLRLLKTEHDQLGLVHYRYIQTYLNTDIEFAELMVHTKNSKILSMNGKMIAEYPANTTTNLTESAALNAALNSVGATSYKWQIPSEEAHLKLELNDENASYFPQGELVYINPSLEYNANGFRLAYRFNIYAQEPMSRAEIYVDAVNGEIIFRNEQIHHTNVTGTANTAYSGVRSIPTDSVNSSLFRLRSSEGGKTINTYNLNLSTNYGSATDFTDTDNIWNNVNAQKDEYATDAHWGASETYDYFLNVHGRNSINNNGFPLNSYIHSSDPQSGSSSYVNAFWDGQRMTYGDGNSSYSPLVALDIAGHEISHGLTTFTANLVYAAESGALNESFSDIFGTAIEFFARPSRANWLIGEDIGSAFRSMSNPLQFGDPDTRLGPSWQNVVGCVPSSQNDQCGVHGNSGVQNKWFYLLTMGGSGTNGIGNAYSVRGTGIDTASAVAFRNLTVYLGRNSNYDDARFFAIKSAVDLYGACTPQVASVTNAWHAVGVGSPYVPTTISDFSAIDTAECKAPFYVNFLNNSTNGLTYFWDFGDGTNSTARTPTHLYQNLGNYDVKLKVDGGACGVDSLEKLNYILVDTNIVCEVLLANGSNATQTTCSGKLYDSGGSTGAYNPNETGTITIAPVGAASVSLNFIMFDVEAGTTGTNCNYDNLQIFDGNSTNASLIGTYCNNNLPSTITSTTGAITLKFTSDPGVELNGFEIDWSCTYPSSSPSPDFIVNASKSCSGEISFEDKTTGAPTSWSWDFGDGNSSNLQNPVHTYNNNGTYTVKLISSNSFGPDSVSKSALFTVNRPLPAISQNDTFCLNQNIRLTANGVGDIKWYKSQNGGTALFNGNVFNTAAVNKDTSFWVEDYIEAPLQSVGPTSNTIGSGNNFTGNQYLIFDVLQPIKLQRVTVFSGMGQTRTIELRDGNGNVLQSKYLYVSSGMQFIFLDFNIQPGTNYQLGLSSGSSVDFYRNDGGVTFPYTIPNMVSIKSSSASSNPGGYYYYFYDWKVKAIDCSSQRIEVKAFIDSTCNSTGIEQLSTNSADFSIYPNPAKNKITILTSTNSTNYTIEVFNKVGELVLTTYSKNTNSNQIDVSSLSNGVYFVKVISQNAQKVKSVVVLK